MNIFAWNFTLENKIKTPDIDFDILQISETSYFVMWWDEEIKNHKEVVSFLEKHFWKIKFYDISIDSEDELEILMSETEWEVYERTVFSWVEVSFDTILERFSVSDEAICVREWKESQFWNREIIVDFVY